MFPSRLFLLWFFLGLGNLIAAPNMHGIERTYFEGFALLFVWLWDKLGLLK